ncbi:putative ubiquinone biosynthesis monooxygenase [Lobulomyces angularis]|nr:putative ubiquinone biosynthesis monooxygenase [Lobulomyces angularis]
MHKLLARRLSTAVDKTYDICIVGAGPVGLSLAAKIGNSHYTNGNKICLIESSDVLKSLEENDTFSNRVVSVTPKSRLFLEEIGCWNNIPEEKVYPYNKIQVFDSNFKGSINFNSRYDEETEVSKASTAPKECTPSSSYDPVAYIIENNVIRSSLIKTLKNLNNEIEIFNNTKVNEIILDKGSFNDEWPIIKLDSGKVIQARLLIGADGQNSPVRMAANIESIGWDYDQSGIVGTLKVSGCSTVAFQRFLPTGPIALLPLKDKYMSLVWTLPKNISNLLFNLKKLNLKNDKMIFKEILNTALKNPKEDLLYFFSELEKLNDGKINFQNISEADKLKIELELNAIDFKFEREWGIKRLDSEQGGISVHDTIPVVEDIVKNSVAGFPLRLRNCRTYIGNRIALIGDAAHSIHPLAGQGLNLGLADSEALGRVLIKAIKNGDDFGLDYILEEYNSERYIKNLLMISSCDILEKVFVKVPSQFRIFEDLISFGLNSLNKMDVLKETLKKYAS